MEFVPTSKILPSNHHVVIYFLMILYILEKYFPLLIFKNIYADQQRIKILLRRKKKKKKKRKSIQKNYILNGYSSFVPRLTYWNMPQFGFEFPQPFKLKRSSYFFFYISSIGPEFWFLKSTKTTFQSENKFFLKKVMMGIKNRDFMLIMKMLFLNWQNATKTSKYNTFFFTRANLHFFLL